MIAFSMSRDIHLISIDGVSAPINLNNTIDRDESDPVFSPGGGRIAYVGNQFNDNLKDGLYIMKADGQNPTQILSSTGAGQQVFRPTWNPQAQEPNEEPAPQSFKLLKLLF
jgi:Tol biopolymer transport system component